MSSAKLVELEDGLRVYASSTMEVRFLYEEIFRDGCYDGVRLPERPLVIDAGANIGMFALFIKLRHPDAEILAFEPAPETAAVLRQNISLHGLDQVTVREEALGSQPEPEAPFTYFPAIPGNSTRYPEQTGPARAALGKVFSDRVAERLYRGREITVPVVRLSSFLSQDRSVDLLKVDVEGGELDVLLGIDPAHWPKIQQVVVEVQDQEGRLDAVCGLLRDQGFEPSVGRVPQAETDVPARLVHATRP